MLASAAAFSPLRRAPPSAAARRRAAAAATVITMRDRSKNRKPTQRGRYLSTEAIQAVQSLKRAALRGGPSAAAAAVPVEPKLRRLLKADMVAVFRELAAQGEALLALQVFEEIRKEHWYKPKLLLYVDIVTVLASQGLRSDVDKVCSYLKREQLEADTEGFNWLLKALLDAEFTQLSMDCFRLMKLWDSDPDRVTYKTLIKGLESLGEMDLSADIKLEAQNDYGDLDFLDEEDMIDTLEQKSIWRGSSLIVENKRVQISS
ncbi:protein THYLAKOID ASSEMBLY 8, chloroplastic-like [Oryza brachyantha]|uniref:protein THYLAKOID ASSEMBLY 8, chloroplastic-like n=1 Tax=Oryza brachyantha TaxID=4533 RepID=UPI001ADAFDD5|nr:protein THYLAKOID ASSEMBLY 8, chloroplastic-like [Oryza brachyantha]